MTEENNTDIGDFEDDEFEIMDNQFLTFSIATEVYGINIKNVMEIIRLIKITSIPESLSFIKGIINLRGKIIPVMDVRLRFNLEEKQYDDRTCIIVIEIQGVEMGLIVDSVAEVMDIPKENIETMPNISNSSNQRFVMGIGKIKNDIKILLALDKLLFDEELEQLKKMQAN